MDLNTIQISKFQESDTQAVIDLIIQTLRTTNIKDEPKEDIESYIEDVTPESIQYKAERINFYVFKLNDQLIGTGAIGPYYGSETESCFFSIFVSPDYQKQGIGRFIMDTLEDDYYYHRAKRLIIPASITAVQFYRNRGYDYINQNSTPDHEGLIYLEKYPN
ncbi:GNAT family N-acetyltransferase [Staphylococcus simulans]